MTCQWSYINRGNMVAWLGRMISCLLILVGSLSSHALAHANVDELSYGDLYLAKKFISDVSKLEESSVNILPPHSPDELLEELGNYAKRQCSEQNLCIPADILRKLIKEENQNAFFDEWRNRIIEKCGKPCEDFKDRLLANVDSTKPLVNKNLVVMETIVKARRILLEAYPFLIKVFESYETWPEDPKDLYKQTERQSIAYARNVATLTLTESLPDIILAQINIERTRLRKTLKKVGLNLTVIQIDQQNESVQYRKEAERRKLIPDNLQNELENQLNQKAAALNEVQSEADVIRARANELKDTIEQSLKNEFTDISKQSLDELSVLAEKELSVIDIKPTADGKPFFRFRLVKDENGNIAAFDEKATRPVEADLYIVRCTGASASGTSLQVNTFEELDLGIRFYRLVQLRNLKLQSTGGAGNVNLDRPEALRDTLYRLGVPKAFDLDFGNTNFGFTFEENGNPIISFGGRIQLKPLGFSAPYRIKIDKKGLDASADGDITHLMNGILSELETKLNTDLEKHRLGFPDNNSSIFLDDFMIVNPEGYKSTDHPWRFGMIVMSATLRVESLPPWPIRIGFKHEDGQTRLMLPRLTAPPEISEAVLRKAHDYLDKKVLQNIEVPSGLTRDDVERILDTLIITEFVFDPEKPCAKGKFALTFDDPNSPIDAGSFLIGAAEKEINFSVLENTVKNLVTQQLKVLIERLEANLTDRLTSPVEFDAFGLNGKLKLTTMGNPWKVCMCAHTGETGYGIEFRDIPVQTRSGDELDDLSSLIKSRKLDLTKGQLTVFRASSCDSSERQVLDLHAWLKKHLAISNDQVTITASIIRDGLKFNVVVNVPSLGKVDLGDFLITYYGSQFVDIGDINRRLAEALERVLTNMIDIPDIGPVYDIEIKKSSFEEMSFTGKVKLPIKGFAPEIEACLFPAFKLMVIGEPEEQLKTLLVGNLSECIKAPAITRFDFNPQPLSFEFDTKFSFMGLEGFEVQACNIRLSAAGLTFPQKIRASFGQPIVLATGVMLVNPSLEFDTKKPLYTRLDGGITLGELATAEGFSKIARLDSYITVDLKALILKFGATGVVANSVPLFKANGSLNFKKSQFSFDAETNEPLDKIVDMKGHAIVDCGRKVIDAYGSMSVLGVKTHEGTISINFPEERIEVRTEISLPLTTQKFEIDARPDFTLKRAHAVFEMGIGNFNISNMKFTIAQNSSLVGFGIFNQNLSVRAMHPSLITEDDVLRAILAILQVDLSKMLDFLKDPDITLSIKSDSGGSVSISEGGEEGGDDSSNGDGKNGSDNQGGVSGGMEEGSSPTGTPSNRELESATPSKPTPQGASGANDATPFFPSFSQYGYTTKFEHEGKYLRRIVTYHDRNWSRTFTMPYLFPQRTRELIGGAEGHRELNHHGIHVCTLPGTEILLREERKSIHGAQYAMLIKNKKDLVLAPMFPPVQGMPEVVTVPLGDTPILKDRYFQHLGQQQSGKNTNEPIIMSADWEAIKAIVMKTASPEYYGKEPVREESIGGTTVYFIPEVRRQRVYDGSSGNPKYIKKEYIVVHIRGGDRIEFEKESHEWRLFNQNTNIRKYILEALTTYKEDITLGIVWTDTTAERVIFAERPKNGADMPVKLVAVSATDPENFVIGVAVTCWPNPWSKNFKPALIDESELGKQLYKIIRAFGTKIYSAELKLYHTQTSKSRSCLGTTENSLYIVSKVEGNSWTLVTNELRSDLPFKTDTQEVDGIALMAEIERSWKDCNLSDNSTPSVPVKVESDVDRDKVIRHLLERQQSVKGFCTSPWFLFDAMRQGISFSN